MATVMADAVCATAGEPTTTGRGWRISIAAGAQAFRFKP
jgi:hypothetical protein